MLISINTKERIYMSILPEKNASQVQSLNELSKRKVVEHNSLITSIAKMDKTPLKMFELAVSLIDTENPLKEDQTVYLSKQELFVFFKVDDSNKHSRFKEGLKKMQNKAFFQIICFVFYGFNKKAQPIISLSFIF